MPCLRSSTFVLFHWDLLLHHFSPLRLLFPLLTIFPTADLFYFWHMSLVILKAIFHYLVTLPRVALFLLELLSLVFFQPAVGCVSFTCFQTSIPFKLILLLIDSTFAASKISASSCTVHLGYHMSTGNFSFVFFFSSIVTNSGRCYITQLTQQCGLRTVYSRRAEAGTDCKSLAKYIRETGELIVHRHFRVLKSLVANSSSF